MAREKVTAERGKFKQEIHAALYNCEDIRNLLVGDSTNMTKGEIRKAFKDRVKSHLFIDDTIEETDSYIFYDVIFPTLKSNIKTCQVVLYAVCHRDILDTYSNEKYPGNRADALAQMVEDCLLNDKEVANSFGIGELTLDSVQLYNSRKYYGCYMQFSVPNFR